MSDRWPIMNKNWSHAAELERRRGLRPSLRQRIERRARELAAIERQRFRAAIIADLHLNRLDPDLVDAWEPLSAAAQCHHRGATET